MFVVDILALVRSYNTMLEQLASCRVNRQWNRIVQTHPLLLWVVDFGDPVRFDVSHLFQTIVKSGSRIRILTVCDFSCFHERYYKIPPLHALYSWIELLDRNLPKLHTIEIIGHLTTACEPVVKAWLKMWMYRSLVPKLDVLIGSCTCCLSWLQPLFDELNTVQPSNRLLLRSRLGYFTNQQCCSSCNRIKKGWFRNCRRCQHRECSSCNYQWLWAPEFKFSSNSCECVDCLRGKPEWLCARHCLYCRVVHIHHEPTDQTS